MLESAGTEGEREWVVVLLQAGLWMSMNSSLGEGLCLGCVFV